MLCTGHRQKLHLYSLQRQAEISSQKPRDTTLKSNASSFWAISKYAISKWAPCGLESISAFDSMIQRPRLLVTHTYKISIRWGPYLEDFLLVSNCFVIIVHLWDKPRIGDSPGFKKNHLLKWNDPRWCPPDVNGDRNPVQLAQSLICG